MSVKYFGMTIDTIMGRMDDTMGVYFSYHVIQ